VNKFYFLFILIAGFALPVSAVGQDKQLSDEPLANEQVATAADGETTDETQSKSPPETVESADETGDGAPMVQENTVDQCGDKKDNDGDGHVDCADQDCAIFAICVKPERSDTSATTAASAKPPSRGGGQRSGESDDELIVRPFSIGFVPGLSTDSAADGEVLNHFSLNFIGWQDHLQGAEFSILGAIRKGNVTGFQGSHLFNVVAGDLRGFQSAGLVNVTAGDTTGFQGAGLVNVAGASVRGIQLSGLGNHGGGAAVGLQGAGLFNMVAGDMTGFQGAGLLNVAGGAMNGFQGAGLVNVSGDGSRGVQMSGIANVSTGSFTGLQLSLVNFGTDVTGAQVGLVNIASKSMKGASVGLINFAGDGIFAPTVWVSAASMLNLGLKMGSRNFYSILGAGVHPVGDDRRTSVAVGFGAHGDLTGKWWMEFDLMHNRLYDQKFGFDSYEDYDVDFIEQARLNLGFRFARDFSVYAGPSLDVLVSEVRDEIGFATFYTHTDKSADTNVAISLGLTAGIQWEPRIGHLNTRD